MTHKYHRNGFALLMAAVLLSRLYAARTRPGVTSAIIDAAVLKARGDRRAPAAA
jgi:hypothetical protein